MTSGVAYIGSSHGILAATRDLIDAAEHAIVLQMYLFAANGDQTLLLPRDGAFAYAETVARWLVDKQRAHPEMPIVVVLDTNTPANPALTRRGGTLVRETLAHAGVVVLNAYLFDNHFNRRRRRVARRMNFHLDHAGVQAADWVEHQNRWQALHNVEDHRKNLVIDGGRAGAITSHNFFDPAWDWHENLFWLAGDPARSLWRSALAAVDKALQIPQLLDARGRATLERLRTIPPSISPASPKLAPVPGYPLALDPPPALDDAYTRIIEHAAIRDRLVALFDGAREGDDVLVATTYFSDLAMLEAIERAARRGARTRVLVDSIYALPLPLLPAWLARSLLNHEVLDAASQIDTPAFQLRVHDSRAGTMMHLKTAARLGSDPVLIGGQANFTPNSFSGAWLETDLETRSLPVIRAFADHFDRLWQLPASRAPSPLTRTRKLTRGSLVRLFALAGMRG